MDPIATPGYGSTTAENTGRERECARERERERDLLLLAFHFVEIINANRYVISIGFNHEYLSIQTCHSLGSGRQFCSISYLQKKMSIKK